MPVATGPLDTPRFTIRYNEGGKTHKVIIPSIALDVTESAKPDTLLASLRAAKAVVLPERPESAIPWPLVGSASGGLLALFLLGLWLRKRSLRPPPPMPPHEWFQQAWDALQAQGLLEKEQEKAHYYALSEIFRGYLERRFDFPALESTSEEIIAWAKEQEELDQEIYRDIRRLLQWMDGIKFAGTRSTPEEREEMDRRLHSVVRRTPQPDAQVSQEEAPQDAA
jgi:DNA-binding PadR family transcriptional regulator